MTTDSQYDADTAILQQWASTGKAEITDWPDMLQRLIQRIEDIAHKTYITIPDTRPSSPPPPPPPAPSTIERPESRLSMNSHPVSPPPSSSPEAMQPTPYPDLPPACSVLLLEIKECLHTYFTTAPPYTIQRMSELILEPKRHYTNLEKFLRALQKSVSVTSSIDNFPLPFNEVEAANLASIALGSNAEDALGGARLTPIPWLEPTQLTAGFLEGEDGTSTVKPDPNGISQGELLRQEQTLNIVPANQITPDEGQVHEGPPGIGAEDVGPQPAGTNFKESDGRDSSPALPEDDDTKMEDDEPEKAEKKEEPKEEEESKEERRESPKDEKMEDDVKEEPKEESKPAAAEDEDVDMEGTVRFEDKE
ncbi:hypothetical protein BJ508DRAFT_410746 [Ascobolus immersus RN42]|uniref:PPP4R2-domain-containing protein n=1 Tax=Ascobolus immersus RN42 TaxID=1160509 RepID=A0A3N4IMU8_ASCIM|nr:hypothetical protein BJ508DRAFT_410746 [Ascobolus immersus RN42]